MFIPDEYFKCEEFRKFLSSAEGGLYFFLRSAIIRDSKLFTASKGYHPAYTIVQRYYRRGMLVARYKQEHLATIMKTTTKRINERLASLEDKGFIKKIKVRSGKSFICYYHFGDWSGSKDANSYNETYLLDEYFGVKSAEAAEQRMEQRHKLIAKKMEAYVDEDDE